MNAIMLEARMADERMKPVDQDAPPELPRTARVEIMDAEGRVLPWQWADSVPWHDAVAYRTGDDGAKLRCDSCGEMTVDAHDKGEVETGICAGCWDHGEFELDGDAAVEEADG